LGVPVVINAEYLERHPLGRAEWIKFMALSSTRKGRLIRFQSIGKRIFDYTRVGKGSITKPSAMSGVVYGDVWFMLEVRIMLLDYK